MPPFTGQNPLQSLYKDHKLIARAAEITRAHDQAMASAVSSVTAPPNVASHRAPSCLKPARGLPFDFGLPSSNAGGGFLELDAVIGVIENAGRPGQSVMLAQSCPSVFGSKQPTSLQQRDHFSAEYLELRR